jgi:subfamily B ATP-binding cassette protein MsbA
MNAFKLYRRMIFYLTVYWQWIVISVTLSCLVVIFEGLSLWFGASLIKTLFTPESQVIPLDPQITFSNLNEHLKFWTYLLVKQDSPLKSLQIVCGIMALTFFLKNILIYLKALVTCRLNLNVVRDMRNQLYDHSLRLPVTYFDKNRSGNIISLIINDIENINNSMTSTFDKLLVEPLRVLFFIGMLFVINVKLTLAVFIIFPVMGVLISQISKVVRRRSKRVLEYIAGLMSILNETIGGIRAVKMFNMNQYELMRFKNENRKFIHSSFRATSIGAISSPLTEVLGVIVVIILLWYGGQQVLIKEGGFGAEDFVRFLIFLFSTFAPLKAITAIANTLQKGFASAERVFTVLDTSPEELKPVQPEKIPVFKDSITFSNVYFSYPGCNEQVLKNINFSIPKGTIVALVGSSGAGKSTILDLVPRFYQVSSGQICIDGKNIDEMDLCGLRQLFGIVSQDTVLFNDTVSNNIRYSLPEASFEQVVMAAKAANALEFIEKLPSGFDTVIGERGVTLSGGQRQRLSIARALLRNPPVLILDEATSALDTESERLVQAAINNLIENRTALVVAHRLSTITHADRIIVMENGEIVETGSHEELLALNRRYKYFYDIQFSSASIKNPA